MENADTGPEADRGLTADIDEVARALGMPGWDLAFVGDGAGRGWDKPIGWDTVLIDRFGGVLVPAGDRPDARAAFSGGMNRGTVEIAELMPYYQGLCWHDRYHGKARRAQVGKPVLDVLIVSDRKSTVAQGQSVQHRPEKLNEVCRKNPLWRAVVELTRHGYQLHWVWQSRGTLALNKLADRMADSAKYAAANALAQATAHVRADLPDRPSDEELIYAFNAAAFGDAKDLSPIKRRKYAKNTGSAGPGFDPGQVPR